MKKYITIYQNKTSTFETWNECSDFISNKKGVKYKGFDSKDRDGMRKFIEENVKKTIIDNLPDVCYIFPYGALYEGKKNSFVIYSYYIIKNTKILLSSTDFDIIQNSESYKNFGELYAILDALDNIMTLHENRVIIYHRFLGIEMWANKCWKAKNKYVEHYQVALDSFREKIVIDFYDYSDNELDFFKINKKNLSRACYDCFKKNKHLLE